MVTLGYAKLQSIWSVADWSQAEIGYTIDAKPARRFLVADWSQAEIGYTRRGSNRGPSGVADWSQAEIGYTDHFIGTRKS